MMVVDRFSASSMNCARCPACESVTPCFRSWYSTSSDDQVLVCSPSAAPPGAGGPRTSPLSACAVLQLTYPAPASTSAITPSRRAATYIGLRRCDCGTARSWNRMVSGALCAFGGGRDDGGGCRGAELAARTASSGRGTPHMRAEMRDISAVPRGYAAPPRRRAAPVQNMRCIVLRVPCASRDRSPGRPAAHTARLVSGPRAWPSACAPEPAISLPRIVPLWSIRPSARQGTTSLRGLRTACWVWRSTAHC